MPLLSARSRRFLSVGAGAALAAYALRIAYRASLPAVARDDEDEGIWPCDEACGYGGRREEEDDDPYDTQRQRRAELLALEHALKDDDNDGDSGLGGGEGEGNSTRGSSARHSANLSSQSFSENDQDGGGSASVNSETPNFFFGTKFFACLELEESQAGATRTRRGGEWGGHGGKSQN
jgi:hypothetical protein